MSGIIDLRGNTQNSEILARMLMQQEQQKLAKEDLNLRKKMFEQEVQERQMKMQIDQQQAQTAAQKQQFEQAQILGPQQAAMQSLLGMANQAASPMLPMGIPVAGGAVNPPPEAVGQFTQMRDQGVPQDQLLAAAPAMAKDAEVDKYMGRLRGHLTQKEYSQFSAALEMVQRGVPKELVDAFLPESAKDVADRLKVEQEIRSMKSTEEADAAAHEALKRYGVNLPDAKGANKYFQDMLVADKAFARQRALQDTNNDRADARTRLTVSRTAEGQLRNNFEQSQVVKTAQTLVSETNKIRQLADKRTGASDTGLVYAYIRVLDTNTGVKEGERGMIQNAGSAAERVKAKIGQWKVGTVLTDAQRERLVSSAEEILESHKQTFTDYQSWYVRNAEAAGVDPAKVTYDPYASFKPRADAAAEERLRRARGK